MNLFVPTLDADTDVLTAALSYAKHDWYVLPVRRGSKHPGSVVGEHWQHQSSREAEQIVAWFAGSDHGIALHIGRSGAVAFDVDVPDQVPAVLTEAFQRDRPPFQSTRTNIEYKGHYLYAVPLGRRIGNSTGKLGKAWGDVRGHNGVLIVEPSQHPGAAEGGRYTWLNTGEVPPLPDELSELLPESAETTDAATDAEVRGFCERHIEQKAPSLAFAVLRSYQNDLAEGGSRHDAMVTAACWAAREARAGVYSARGVFQRLQAVFVESMATPRTGSTRAATEAVARSEFVGIVAWAVAQAEATDLAEIRCGVEQRIPGFDAPPPEPPEDDDWSAPGEAAPADNESNQPPADWPELDPLDPPRRPAVFPADTLPGWAAEYVVATAEATQTPLDLPGCCVLGVLSACAGGRAVVQARPGWREPVNLYLLPILRPGSRKTAVVSATTGPLYEIEKDLAKKAQAEIAEATTLREIAEQSAKKARGAAASATKKEDREKLIAEAVSAASDVERIAVPFVPRLIADDVTPEAAASLLADNGGRLAIISAEGGIFDMMAGRYNQGVPVLDLWLKGHAGDPLRVDRKGRPSECVDRPALTLLLTVQPSVLAAIADNGAFRGRGLLARFLYALPADNLGRRKVGAQPVSADLHETYRDHIRELAADMADWTDPAVLTLSPDAHELLLDTEREIEPQLAEEGTLGPIAEWGSKLAGTMLRIAGLLHLASESEAFRVPISRATLSNAIRIGTYFTEHARAAFNLLGETGTSDARYLLDYLIRKDIAEFTIRDLHTDLPRGRFPKVHVVTQAVEVLAERGYVQPKPETERTGPGRKSSPGYIVRPEVSAESAQSAELRRVS